MFEVRCAHRKSSIKNPKYRKALECQSGPRAVPVEVGRSRPTGFWAIWPVARKKEGEKPPEQAKQAPVLQRFLWWNEQREHTSIAPGIELPAAVLAVLVSLVHLALLPLSLSLVLHAAGGAPFMHTKSSKPQPGSLGPGPAVNPTTTTTTTTTSR